jgi:hypothetical protein
MLAIFIIIRKMVIKQMLVIFIIIRKMVTLLASRVLTLTLIFKVNLFYILRAEK